jgi:hypothetical protein
VAQIATCTCESVQLRQLLAGHPVAESAFSEPNGEPPRKKVPSWAVVARGDKAAGTDVVRSVAERAGATITVAEGSHVIMMSSHRSSRMLF